MPWTDITDPLSRAIMYIATLVFILLLIAGVVLLRIYFVGEPDWNDILQYRVLQ